MYLWATWLRYNRTHRGVAQWLARHVRDVEAGGSNPLTPTISYPLVDEVSEGGLAHRGLVQQRACHAGVNSGALQSNREQRRTCRVLSEIHRWSHHWCGAYHGGDILWFRGRRYNPETAQFGFVMAVAILLDATIVRSVLVPATIKLLGDRNWYLPGFLNWLPALSAEGSGQSPPEDITYVDGTPQTEGLD